MKEEYKPIIDEIKEKETLERYANYYFLLHFWMERIEEGKKIIDFFDKRGYRKIAIYGMGQLGHHLLAQLGEKVNLLYTVDREMVSYNGELFSLVESKSIISRADVMVVTPVVEYQSIKKRIMQIAEVDVISLEEVILSL